MMSWNEMELLANRHRISSDPIRLAILHRLEVAEVGPRLIARHISELSGVTRSSGAIGHQLEQLKNADLIEKKDCEIGHPPYGLTTKGRFFLASLRS